MARQRATSDPSPLSAPPVNTATGRDPLLPPSPPNNAQNVAPPTNLLSKSNLIILVAVLCHALIYYAASTSMFNPAARDQIRRHWDSERFEHRAWQKAREAERMEAERHRKKKAEEEERRHAGIHWLGLERSEHCERYGTRKYWAKLGPVAHGYDRLKACWTTEMDIHGWKVKPTYCDDKGTDRGVWGYWVVDFNEGGCRPSWERFKDKGCTAPGSGLRRFEAHLMNLDSSDRWDSMCSSTPTDFKGLHFDGPMSCANRGLFGVYGSWDIDDSECR